MHFEAQLAKLLNEHGMDAQANLADDILAANIVRHILNLGVTNRAAAKREGRGENSNPSLR